MELKLSSANLPLNPRSLTQSAGAEFGLVQDKQARKLVVLAPHRSPMIAEFEGESSEYEDHCLVMCPMSTRNAALLRKHLPWLRPQLVGLYTSAGMGDRLGIATPGHVRATRETHGSVFPIFAQQSIREMQRTNRTPQQVMDDVLWGCFEEGWQAGFGSDADHLKNTQDIDACLAAGYTLYTIDPGQYVNDRVNQINKSQVLQVLQDLPASQQPGATGLLDKTIEVDGIKINLDEEVLLKAITKYGKAVDHIVRLYQHLEQVASGHTFEVEISMDETAQPTTPAEHVYVASELRRLGVMWVSFAPRFTGRFEKGVDYIGNLDDLEDQLSIHAAIARQYGPYKLSLHSGSDKFSIYPMFMHHTRGSVHLKTAGTSYLEALRTIADLNPDLFKEIYIFGRANFEIDRKSYHVSASLEKAPMPDEVHDWPALLDQFDAREILHVTFGSVLTAKVADGSLRFYSRMEEILNTHREHYFDHLVRHFKRHLDPFTTAPVA